MVAISRTTPIFVVHVHDGKPEWCRHARCFELVETMMPLRWGAAGHFKPFALADLAGVQHRFVLGLAGDDAFAFFDKAQRL